MASRENPRAKADSSRINFRGAYNPRGVEDERFREEEFANKRRKKGDNENYNFSGLLGDAAGNLPFDEGGVSYNEAAGSNTTCNCNNHFEDFNICILLKQEIANMFILPI
jgi:hypothetical protein